MEARPLISPRLLSVHFLFKFFGLDQELATEWPSNWSTGLILGAFCTISELDQRGLGAKFGQEPTQHIT